MSAALGRHVIDPDGSVGLATARGPSTSMPRVLRTAAGAPKSAGTASASRSEAGNEKGPGAEPGPLLVAAHAQQLGSAAHVGGPVRRQLHCPDLLFQFPFGLPVNGLPFLEHER
jgi:hypothetical protein